MARYGPLERGGLELASYLTVRGRRSGEDSLAVGEEEMANVVDAQRSVSCVVETTKCDIFGREAVGVASNFTCVFVLLMQVNMSAKA